MTRRPSLTEELLRANERARAKVREMRNERPDLYVSDSAELMFSDNVADLLSCSVDKVLRIPRRELPAVKVGKRLQYFRSDVLEYAKSVRDKGPTLAADTRRRGGTAKPQTDFDPIKMLKSRLPTGKKG
ncbi:MAG: hypothetical protein RIR33_3697 [Pseudomonadota bacterium]|jgi:hypothetical protein